VVGTHYSAATGHYLGTAAAMRILDGGGNAIDAGVTAAMALAMLQPDMVSFAGVAPTLIYLKKEDRVISLAGLGYWDTLALPFLGTIALGWWGVLITAAWIVG
jgi:gamma-glutamyltranspeptidase/glutathione hydrolase